MANILKADRQCVIVGALAEGSSIRSIERMTGVHRDTIMRLGVRVGSACGVMMDGLMRELPCTDIQVDEIWGFVGKKQRTATPEESSDGMGDVWTYVAIDRDTKVVPTFTIGKRDYVHTLRFITDLEARVKNRIQLSSDSLNTYIPAIDEAFGTDVDYGQIVKVYSAAEESEQRRYSPPKIAMVQRSAVRGAPAENRICTSHVERQNLTMRMHMRRLTRLTNAFSKKLENFKAAVALHFAYYNFVKVHSSVRMTPAMAAGVASRLWTVNDLVGLKSPDL